MALEQGTVITDLQPSYPQDNELIKDGAAHLRLIKGILTNTLKGFNKIVTMTSDKLNLFDTNFDLSSTASTVKTALVATANPTASTANNWDLKGNDIMNVGSASYTSQEPAKDRRAASIADIIKYSGQSSWPVNVVYISTSAENPKDVLGFGTWVAYSQGRVLAGVGSAAGMNIANSAATGGNATATLSIPNMPVHNHGAAGLSGTANMAGEHDHKFLGDDGVAAYNKKVQGWNYDARSHGGDGGIYVTTTDGGHTHSVTINGATANAGSGQAFSIQQPWQGVYMWRRTA